MSDAGPRHRRSGRDCCARARPTATGCALARLLSWSSAGGAPSPAVARLAYRAAVPYTVGLTGAPGAGKSTLTDRLIPAAPAAGPSRARRRGGATQVAVLAVDPTSPFSGGAILGDRVRMGQHALDPTVFIRSMATRGHLGGLALAVPDAVRVLGRGRHCRVVIVETVGVGQMEVEIASAADTTVVVVTPGWGDSMQANKAGLLEVADVFVINKADRPGVPARPGGTSSRCSTSRPAATGGPPMVETTAVAARASTSCGRRSPAHRSYLRATGLLEQRPGGRGWHRSCAGCCWPGWRPGRRAGRGRGVRHGRQGAGRRGARPLRGGRRAARRGRPGALSRPGPGPPGGRYGASMADDRSSPWSAAPTGSP